MYIFQKQPLFFKTGISGDGALNKKKIEITNNF